LKKTVSDFKMQVESSNRELVELKKVGNQYREAEESIRQLQEELSNKTRSYLRLQEEGIS